MPPSAESIERAINAALPAGSDSASEPSPVSPASAAGSGVESAPAGGDASSTSGGAATPSGAAVSTSAADPAAKTKHELLAEKLGEVRDRRKAQRLEQTASERLKKASEAEKVAAEERAKWEGLKTGSFLDVIKAQGRDPKIVFEEMRAEAIRAGTPEAQIELMQKRFDAQLAAAVEPLKKTIEELTEREKATVTREEKAHFQSDFTHEIQAEGYKALRVEYGDERLFRLVDGLKANPGQLRAHAKALGVKLTYDDERFNMQDILNVLSRAQVSHEEEKQRRAGQLAAPSQAAQAPAEKTVNGAIERAGNPLGNAPATTRVSTEKSVPRLTRAERIAKLASSG